MLKPRYEVGSCKDIFYFEDKDCALSFYKQLQEHKVGRVWLKDTHENLILANTFGWGEQK